jgi:hypothetical protein
MIVKAPLLYGVTAGLALTWIKCPCFFQRRSIAPDRIMKVSGIRGGSCNRSRLIARDPCERPVRFASARAGAQRFRLPLIVMPAGDAGEYRLRYHEEGTPQQIADRIRMATDLAQEGCIKGVVIYCLDKREGSASFEAARKVFAAVRKPGEMNH